MTTSVVVAAGAADGSDPFAVRADQMPTSLMPCPFASPGLVSPTNVYNGMPLKVSWVAPFGRLTVPSEPTLPLATPPAGAASGCHTFTQAELVQIHFPFCSPDRWYSVRP